MTRLQRFIGNTKTVLRQPAIVLEYASWAIQTVFGADGPVRTVCGVRIGDFIDFSEYHSMARGVSVAELEFLRRHDFGDGAIIDVGANLGLFSLVMSERFPDRRIVAFEPAPSTFAALSKNIARNGAANIECHQLAVADHDGTSTFVVLESARANSAIAVAKPTAGKYAIDIECITLDRFCGAGDLERIALMKVDVEGFEISVFRGAEHVLSRVRPRVVYFEVCPALARSVGFEPAAAAVVLEEKGYALHRLLGDGRLQNVHSRDVNEVVLENWVGLDTQ